MKMLIKRLYAGLIDITFVGMIIFILYMFYFYSGLKLDDFKIDLGGFTGEYKIVFYFAMLVFYIISELFNFSPGKKLFKIKINYGEKVKTARFLRPFFKLAILLFVPVGALVGIAALFTNENRLLYDCILKTSLEEARYERRDLR